MCGVSAESTFITSWLTGSELNSTWNSSRVIVMFFLLFVWPQLSYELQRMMSNGTPSLFAKKIRKEKALCG
jgi:hypothetical protein